MMHGLFVSGKFKLCVMHIIEPSRHGRIGAGIQYSVSIIKSFAIANATTLTHQL